MSHTGQKDQASFATGAKAGRDRQWLNSSRPSRLGELAREAILILDAAGVENAQQEAFWLIDGAIGVNRLTMRLDEERLINADERSRVMNLLMRRAVREPLQYVLGTQEFCGLDFFVGTEALIPRPETELLVEVVGRHCASTPVAQIADIGTGSGCIAVALAKAWPQAFLYAIDESAAALDLARRNAVRHAVDVQIEFLNGDLFEPLSTRGLVGSLTAVVSNPPYIADRDLASLQPEVKDYEPRLALAGGPDGLVVIRRLIDHAARYLVSGGLLAIEVGRGQASGVRDFALEHGGYSDIRSIKDAAGIERVLCLVRA